MRYLLVAALMALAGAGGWWLRGHVDPVPVRRARTHRPEPAARQSGTTRPDLSGPGPPRGATSDDPYHALLDPRAPDETPIDRLARVLGGDVDMAATALPDLLARARAEMDDPRIRAILQLMVATGRPELLATVLEAMVSDDTTFDFAHRDDFFRDVLAGVASADVGEAALRRLRWETSRGEIGPGEIAGYATLLGASRLPAGRAFLEEMLAGKFGGDWQASATATEGLLATGDPAVLEQFAQRRKIDDHRLKTFLARAGEAGWETVERLAVDPATRANVAEAAARLSAREKRPGTVGFLERLWESGARRPALAGCSSLRDGVPRDAAERLRDIVFRAVAEAGDTEARRSAFYVIEYSPLFQTERARALLKGIIAAEKSDYWVRAARDALRNVERTLRRAEVQR